MRKSWRNAERHHVVATVTRFSIRARCLAVFVVLLWLMKAAAAQESTAEKTEPAELRQRPNISFKTLGGKQYWEDIVIYGGWRVQRNVFTKHCRLLDDRDIRRAWGSFRQCEQALEEAKETGRAELRSRKLCILLHGYLRSKDSLKKLKRTLESEGYEVYAINYPGMRFTLERFAEQVAGIIDVVEDDFDEIHMVTQSMGGIVARGVLSDGHFPKVHRLVMIAPPNQGAIMADLLLGWWPSESVVGPAGKQLAKDAESYARNAGIPKCQVGVIAGVRGKKRGWNPIIPGGDDGLVGVDDARLEGMADFVTVNAWHSSIMKHADTLRQTIFFLKHGRFEHELEETTQDPAPDSP